MDSSDSRAGSLWQRLVYPSQEILAESERSQAQLLASLNIVLLPLITVSVIISIVFGRENTGAPLILAIPFLLSLGISYLLSRTRYYQSGALLLILAFSTASILAGQFNPVYRTIGPVSVSISIILAAIFFRPRQLIIIGIANWAGLILALYFLPGEMSFNEGRIVVLWVAVMTIIIIVWLSYYRTIEQRRQQEHIQLEVYKEKTAFMEHVIHSLSHDLKTPLTIINTSLYLLEKLSGSEKQQEKIENIKIQAQRLEQLIQEILAISRLDNLPELTFEPVDLNKIVLDLKSSWQPLLDGKQLQIQYQLDDTIPAVAGNPQELQRALSNLIENAIRYTEDGIITVETGFGLKQVKIVVEDTGIGIDPADLPHIFERFYRADKSRNAYTGGTGLGLSIVSKIVERHSGDIAVSSNPGQGSSFSITLPVYERSSK